MNSQCFFKNLWPKQKNIESIYVYMPLIYSCATENLSWDLLVFGDYSGWRRNSPFYVLCKGIGARYTAVQNEKEKPFLKNSGRNKLHIQFRPFRRAKWAIKLRKHGITLCWHHWQYKLNYSQQAFFINFKTMRHSGRNLTETFRSLIAM